MSPAAEAPPKVSVPLILASIYIFFIGAATAFVGVGVAVIVVQVFVLLKKRWAAITNAIVLFAFAAVQLVGCVSRLPRMNSGGRTCLVILLMGISLACAFELWHWADTLKDAALRTKPEVK